MGLWARLSGKKQSVEKVSGDSQKTQNRSFRGVIVRADEETCCQLVQTITDERFLLEDAPMLPLSMCDAKVCNCTYERFNDRRGAVRRASDLAFDINSELIEQENRDKKSPGRRAQDSLDF